MDWPIILIIILALPSSFLKKAHQTVEKTGGPLRMFFIIVFFAPIYLFWGIKYLLKKNFWIWRTFLLGTVAWATYIGIKDGIPGLLLVAGGIFIWSIISTIELSPNTAEEIKSTSNQGPGEADKILQADSRAAKAEIDAISDAGFAFYRAGNYKEAVQQYNNIISLRPNYAHAYFQRGINNFKLGNFREAAIDCQKAADIVNCHHPNNIPDFINVTEQYYDEYSSLWFDLDFVYVVLGHSFFEMKKYRDAITAWEHSITLHPINEYDLREKLEEARSKC